MRRLIPIVAVLAALVGAQPATTTTDKTVTVSITHVAFVPNSVTITTGDLVTWTNNDTVNHQLVSQAAGIGSPIIKPSESYSFTFSKAGRFSITDALNKQFPKMTVVAKAAATTLSLESSTSAVIYGGTATLSGKLSTGETGVKIDPFAQMCGENASKRVTSSSVTTTTGGVFSFAVRPVKTSVYMVKSGNATSSSLTVKTRPKVVLSKIRVRKFRIRVYAADAFVGHAVVFQRYRSALGRWQTVKTVVLRRQAAAVTPLPGTIVSSVSFGVRLRHGFRVRAVMTSASAAPCYVAGRSATIRS